MKWLMINLDVLHGIFNLPNKDVYKRQGPILEIAREHNLKVIEDCAQCFGGEYKGVKAGLIGDVGCFSFCQSKHFTTGGEGGMVVTNNEDLGWECRSFRDHGYDCLLYTSRCV